MRLGDNVIWQGRIYVLRGFEPMSLPKRMAELADGQTMERIWVALEELEQATARPRLLRKR